MNRADPSKTVLITSFTISAALHLAIWGVVSGFVKIGNLQASDPKHPTRSAPTPREPELRLGIDDSPAYTLTWLGFKEATDHAGEVSTVEQSAMTPHAGGPAVPAPPAAATPNLTPATAPNITSNQVREAAESALGVGRRLSLPIQAAAKAPDAKPGPATPSGAAGVPGLPSDKEAMASAIKKAPTVVLGKALATEGLDIQTRSPKWSMTTLQTRRPFNPTVEITFGRDGKVIRAGFAREGVFVHNTGYDDVDEPLMSAIYTWTARGKHLAELTSKDPKGEVTILITIILTG